MAICRICGQEMKVAKGCLASHLIHKGTPYERIKFMGTGGEGKADSPGSRCPDCDAQIGQYHHMGCDLEICPICGGQLLSCKCKKIGICRP